jgi:predicted nicotinamide N-methyase
MRLAIGGDARAAAEVSDVVEVVVLGGREVEIARPADAEALLSEEAFEQEELLPYWAELWPSARVLAADLARRALGARRVLDLGCGLGLAAVGAALAGARVTATDWAPDALAYTAANAARNGVAVETLRADWNAPDALVARAPWDLVVGSDLLYERRNVAPLLALLPRLGAEALIADPGRAPAEAFLAGATAWRVRTTVHGERPPVRLHALARG